MSVHLPVAGLYSSALCAAASEFAPPSTSTSPLASSQAFSPYRAMFILPVLLKPPARAGPIAVITIVPMVSNSAKRSFIVFLFACWLWHRLFRRQDHVADIV